MRFPRGYIDQKKIRAGIAAVERETYPDVVRIRYDLGEDWTGEPSVFFRVLLSDDASEQSRLYANAQRITAALLQAVRPEDLGLLAYFNFRSHSEQQEINEPAWI